MACTFDGASVNRSLASLHASKGDIVYKVPNIYAKDKRSLYFFTDPPHLMKTVRNCWASQTWVNGFYEIFVIMMHYIE